MREECLVMAWLDKCVSIVEELTLLNISDLASKVVIGFSFILTFPALCNCVLNRKKNHGQSNLLSQI